MKTRRKPRRRVAKLTFWAVVIQVVDSRICAREGRGLIGGRRDLAFQCEARCRADRWLGLESDFGWTDRVVLVGRDGVQLASAAFGVGVAGGVQHECDRADGGEEAREAGCALAGDGAEGGGAGAVSVSAWAGVLSRFEDGAGGREGLSVSRIHSGLPGCGEWDVAGDDFGFGRGLSISVGDWTSSAGEPGGACVRSLVRWGWELSDICGPGGAGASGPRGLVK